MRLKRYWWVAVAVVIALVVPLQQAYAASGSTSGVAGASGSAGAAGGVSGYSGLSRAQQASLLSIARDTWKFYGVDIDDPTRYHLTIDATALDTDACVSLMVVAAHALGA